MNQIVYNLYPFNEHLYLPSANIVQVDRQGQLSHILQKAIPATLASYSLEMTPLVERMMGIIDGLTPKKIEAKFKPPKAKLPTALPQLLADVSTKIAVESYIYREMDAFLSEIAQNRLPLTLDAERKTMALDVLIALPTEELLPHISFRKTGDGVEYRLQLGVEDEKWTIQQHTVLPLTNTEPAWLLVDNALFRVPGINGNMVRPFRQKDVIHIPPDKMRVYFKQFIAKSAGRTRIEAEGFDMQTTDILQSTRLEPTEHILDKTWLLKPIFTYDGADFFCGERRDRVTTVNFSGEAEQDVSVWQVCRNAGLEAEQLGILKGMGLAQEGSMLSPTADASLPGRSLDALVSWLASHRTALEAAGFILGQPLDGGRAIALLPGNLSLRSEAQGDWFDVQGRVNIGPHSFSFKDFLPYIRRQDRYFPLPDETFFLIPEEWMTRYAELAMAAKDGEDEVIRLPKSLFTIVQEAGLAEGEQAGALPAIDPDQIDYQPSGDLKATLRPYQLRGVKWLVGHYRHGFGACLADDMGLGKTLQTIAVLLYAKSVRTHTPAYSNTQNEANEAAENSGPILQMNLFQDYRQDLKPLNALIILPASLVFNWQQELTRFAPSLFVYAHSGPKRLKDARAMAGFDVVLTTYHTARQDLDLLSKTDWHYIVLDESQQIKNRESEVSKVVRALEAQNKISLSGTPIENSLADLWAQMEFINPDTLGSFKAFREQFLWPIEKQNDERAKQRLFNRVRPFFLRRTKEEVAPDLPKLSAQIFYSEMATEQNKRYEQMKSAMRNEILSLFDDPKTRIQALVALTRLRQLANHPTLADADFQGASGKFDDVLAQWDTIRRAGHKVLFFSSFEKHLQLFRQIFEQSGHAFAWLTGDTATSARAQEVARFQTDPTVQAFFMTIKAGGVGLNLTAADYVFILDPWWNPAVEEQAIARAHRIGQTRPVTALRFIARGTIEEKIRDLQEHKRALGKGLFGAGEEMPALDRADMEMLLA